MEDLVLAYSDGVFRFMRHLTRHQEAAEDLTQQTFLKAIGRITTFRGEAPLRVWLHRIALHEYTAWRRKQRWIPMTSESMKSDPGYKLVDEAEAFLDLLHSLPDAQREALLLHHVEDLSIEEIAIVTNSPAGTVKSRLHHGRKKLRQLAQFQLENH